MIETNRIYIFTQTMAVFVLLAALLTGLLPALLGGLLVYHLVEFGSRLLVRAGIVRATGKLLLLILLALIVISAFTLGAVIFVSKISDGNNEGFVILLRTMADVVDKGRSYLPLWMQSYLPANFEEWQVAAAHWLRENASHFSEFGKEAGHTLVHLLFGMIIGGLVALSPGFQEIRGPLAREISDRVGFLCNAFGRIVFSQVQISALNTVLTAIFLAIVLPMAGYPLPMTKTMIIVTFVAGLLPIVGNLISNTVIFLVSLSVAPMAALWSMVFLVVVHKLEYFMNAHIIGTRIRAKAWELLLAMLVMESVFGIAGLVAAPIYYAYIKDELKARKLI